MLYCEKYLYMNIIIMSNIKISDTHIIRTGLKKPTSLTVTGDNIFWTELDSEVLYWTNFKSISSNHKAVAFREFVLCLFNNIECIHVE